MGPFEQLIEAFEGWYRHHLSTFVCNIVYICSIHLRNLDGTSRNQSNLVSSPVMRCSEDEFERKEKKGIWGQV